MESPKNRFPIHGVGRTTADVDHDASAPLSTYGVLPAACAEWEMLANELPRLLAGERLRTEVRAMPPFPVNKLVTVDWLRRGALYLGAIAHAYVWADEPTASMLPAVLAVPFYQVNQALGRPAVLNFETFILDNWRVVDASRPVRLGNLATRQNLAGGMDEDWFILCHVEATLLGAPVTGLLGRIQAAAHANNGPACANWLEEIAICLDAARQALDRLPERCEPGTFLARTTPLLRGWPNRNDLPDGLFLEGVAEHENSPVLADGILPRHWHLTSCVRVALGHAFPADQADLEYAPTAVQKLYHRLEAGPRIGNLAQRDRAVREACTRVHEAANGLDAVIAAQAVTYFGPHRRRPAR